MRSRSKPRGQAVLGISAAALLVALPLLLGSLRVSSRIIVPAGEVVEEDLYAFGGLVVVEGTIRGDLFAVTGELRISGEVEGDVMGLVGGPAKIDGAIGGAVRVAAIRLDVTGSVGDDLAALVAEAEVRGTVSRDVFLVGGEANFSGSVGRDVRLQSVRLELGGDVGRDVLVKVDRLTVGPDATVGGDLLYQASAEATVGNGSSVAGQFVRRTVLAPVWAKALTRAFLILSAFGLIVAGLAAQWVFRSTSRRALDFAGRRPWRAALVGLGALLVPPLVAVPLFLTLVGIPVALVILVAWVVGLMVGPIPAVTQLGTRMLRGRGGPAAALVVGVLVWRGAIWLLPLIGALIYVAALLVGVGSYVSAGWELREQHGG